MDLQPNFSSPNASFTPNKRTSKSDSLCNSLKTQPNYDLIGQAIPIECNMKFIIDNPGYLSDSDESEPSNETQSEEHSRSYHKTSKKIKKIDKPAQKPTPKKIVLSNRTWSSRHDQKLADAYKTFDGNWSDITKNFENGTYSRKFLEEKLLTMLKEGPIGPENNQLLAIYRKRTIMEAFSMLEGFGIKESEEAGDGSQGNGLDIFGNVISESLDSTSEEINALIDQKLAEVVIPQQLPVEAREIFEAKEEINILRKLLKDACLEIINIVQSRRGEGNNNEERDDGPSQ